MSQNKENVQVLKQLFLLVHPEELFQEKNPLRSSFLKAHNEELPEIYDLSDESGRRNLSFLLRELLEDINLHGSLVPISISLFKKVLIEQRQFISYTYEIISNFYLYSQKFYEILTNEEQKKICLQKELKELKRELKNDTDENLENQIVSKQNETEEKLNQNKEKIEKTELIHKELLFRILTIAYHLLLFSSPSDLPLLKKQNIEMKEDEEEKICSLETLMQYVIFPSISKFCSIGKRIDEENSQFCLLTLSVVGQYSLLDCFSHDSSDKVSSIFFSAQEIVGWMSKFVLLQENFKIKLTAVKSLFDIHFLSPSNSRYFNTNFIRTAFDDFSNLFSSLTNKKHEKDEDEYEDEDSSESPQQNHKETEVLINLYVEGFAKLLLANKFESDKELTNLKEKLLTKMICLYTGKEVKANQYLNIFFPTYSYSAIANQLSLTKLVVPVMQMLIYSTSQSMAHLEKTGKFLLDLCDSKKILKKDVKNVSFDSFAPFFFDKDVSEQNTDNKKEMEEKTLQLIESFNSEHKLCLEFLFATIFPRKSLQTKNKLGDYKFQQLFMKEIKIYLKVLSVVEYNQSSHLVDHFFLSTVICLIEKLKENKRIDKTTNNLAVKLSKLILKLKNISQKEQKIISKSFGVFKSQQVFEIFEKFYCSSENSEKTQKKTEKKRGKKISLDDEDSVDEISLVEIESDEGSLSAEEEKKEEEKKIEKKKMIEVISEDSLLLSTSDEEEKDVNLKDLSFGDESLEKKFSEIHLSVTQKEFKKDSFDNLKQNKIEKPLHISQKTEKKTMKFIVFKIIFFVFLFFFYLQKK